MYVRIQTLYILYVSSVRLCYTLRFSSFSLSVNSGSIVQFVLVTSWNLNGILGCVWCCAVVVFCHSRSVVRTQFLFRAQDLNMTNGDFAFFTFRPVRSPGTDKPWTGFFEVSEDLPRRLRAFYAVITGPCLLLHVSVTAVVLQTTLL